MVYVSCQTSPRRIGTAAPSASIPSTSTSGPPIMKSVCIDELLKPTLVELGLREVAPVRDRLEDAGAVRDVARRVLVEERVQERQARAADARVAVDECDLAEHRRAVVRAKLLTHHVRARRRVCLDCAAALETDLEVAHDRAGECERLRRADGSLGAAIVRTREDLLGRHVRHVAAPVDRLLERRAPLRAGNQADRQVRARAAEPEAVEATIVQDPRALDQLLDVVPPGVDRVGLVQPDRRRDRVPEPFDVWFAEDGLAPNPRSGTPRSTS